VQNSTYLMKPGHNLDCLLPKVTVLFELRNMCLRMINAYALEFNLKFPIVLQRPIKSINEFHFDPIARNGAFFSTTWNLSYFIGIEITLNIQLVTLITGNLMYNMPICLHDEANRTSNRQAYCTPALVPREIELIPHNSCSKIAPGILPNASSLPILDSSAFENVFFPCRC